MGKNIKSFWLGVVLTIFVITSSATLMAEPVQKTVDAIFGKIKVFTDGKPVDQETMLIDGTTYVPVRALATAMNMDLNWNESDALVQLTSRITDDRVVTHIRTELYDITLPILWQEVHDLNMTARFQAASTAKNGYMISIIENKQFFKGTFEEFCEAAVKKLTERFPDVTQSEKQDMVINDDLAKVYIINGLSNDIKLTYKVAVIEHEDYYSHLYFWSSEADYNSVCEDFDRILMSYKVHQ